VQENRHFELQVVSFIVEEKLPEIGMAVLMPLRPSRPLLTARAAARTAAETAGLGASMDIDLPDPGSSAAGPPSPTATASPQSLLSLGAVPGGAAGTGMALGVGEPVCLPSGEIAVRGVVYDADAGVLRLPASFSIWLNRMVTDAVRSMLSPPADGTEASVPVR
jgi:hypothetical protein